MAGDKVRCAVCKHQVNAFCLVKKSKVALNKRRKCDKHKIEPGKVRLKQKIPTTRGISPLLYKDLRKEYKKKAKEDAIKKQLRDSQMTVSYSAPLKKSNDQQPITGNAKHPLTGDLGRFTSTAGEGD